VSAIRFPANILAAARHCFLSDDFIDICIDFIVQSSPLSRVTLCKYNYSFVSPHAMRNIWICSTVVFLACVGLVDRSNESVVLACLCVLASSNFELSCSITEFSGMVKLYVAAVMSTGLNLFSLLLPSSLLFQTERKIDKDPLDSTLI
jgi:hypothetical protein